MTTAQPTAAVSLKLDPALLPRVEKIAQDLEALDQRLHGLPADRMDEEDRDEVRKLRSIVMTYSSTVLELVEPQQVVQDTIAAKGAFVADLVAVMERFIGTTNEALDEAMAAPTV